ncbi:hypothetical protein ES703_123398 [subsurface metagenome]
MHLFFYKALYCVQDNGGTEQYCAGHCKKLGVEAAAAIKEPGNTAVYQQYSAGQCPQQGHAYANLLAAGMFGSNVFFKM